MVLARAGFGAWCVGWKMGVGLACVSSDGSIYILVWVDGKGDDIGNGMNLPGFSTTGVSISGEAD